MTDRPKYADLPRIPGTDIPSAWGVYGQDDQLGGLNLLTADRVRAAAALVRTGERFQLGLPLDQPDPPLYGRQPLHHEVSETIPGVVLDDKIDGFFPQAGSQWDALAHFGYPGVGFYNGTPLERVTGEGALGVHNIARDGIAGRGILLDVARHLAVADPAYDPNTRYEISADVLRDTAAAQRVQFAEGDIVCVRTGWVGWYKEQSAQVRVGITESSLSYRMTSAGLGPAAGIAELAWEEGFALLAVDNSAVEPSPIAMDEAGVQFDLTCHVRVMVALGINFGEFFDFEELAAACAGDGRYEFLLTSAPLQLQGGIGSPPNALAIR
jgi:kynurenine formamidase